MNTNRPNETDNQLNDRFEKNKLSPYVNEKPSSYADRLGIFYSAIVDTQHKKISGQFFTPVEIARFMASFTIERKTTIKILDPGCGIGILSAAVAETIITNNKNVKTIELVAFETDVKILPLVDQCLEYLATWLKARKINFTYFLCKNDFIMHNTHVLTNQGNVNEYYDVVISNPPYFKLPKDDERVIAARAVIFGQTNIYSIFLLIAAKLLSNTGVLIFITPRSFCSGNYFRLFREIFFSIIRVQTVHLFNSRKDAFKRDRVLQENIIIIGQRHQTIDPYNSKSKLKKIKETRIAISSSKGVNDIDQRRIKEYKWSDLVNVDSYQKILHLPASDVDEEVISIFKTWTGSLSSYGLGISTGPVVDFRSHEMISSKNMKKTVPLIWLHNVESMKITWPKSSDKGKTKGQFIILNEDSITRLVPNKNYVLLRRFSAKDDLRRLIAAPYFKESTKEYQMLGIENHLNYIYHKSNDLSDIEIVGLAALINSRLFDVYFRTFNGNINVSATELRDFPLPDYKLIKQLGKKILNMHSNQKNIDFLVSKIFNISIDLFDVYGR